jgi:hypothetical protein
MTPLGGDPEGGTVQVAKERGSMAIFVEPERRA